MWLSTESALRLCLDRFRIMRDHERASNWMQEYMRTPAVSEAFDGNKLVLDLKYIGHRMLELRPGESRVIQTGLVPNHHDTQYDVSTPKPWVKRGLTVELINQRVTNWPATELKVKLINSDTQTLGFEPGCIVALLNISAK